MWRLRRSGWWPTACRVRIVPKGCLDVSLGSTVNYSCTGMTMIVSMTGRLGSRAPCSGCCRLSCAA
jgi:hypothetical protein